MDDIERDQAQCDAQLQREFDLYLQRQLFPHVVPPAMTKKTRQHARLPINHEPLDYDAIINQITAAAERDDTRTTAQMGQTIQDHHTLLSEQSLANTRAHREKLKRRERRTKRRKSVLATASEADLISETSSHAQSEHSISNTDPLNKEVLSNSPIKLHRQVVSQSVGYREEVLLKRSDKKRTRKRSEVE